MQRRKGTPEQEERRRRTVWVASLVALLLCTWVLPVLAPMVGLGAALFPAREYRALMILLIVLSVLVGWHELVVLSNDPRFNQGLPAGARLWGGGTDA